MTLVHMEVRVKGMKVIFVSSLIKRFATRRGDTVLNETLENPKKNSTYTNSATQNDVIACR